MTLSEALSRVRGLLNESAEGFYTDELLYSYLDSAQMEVVTMCKSKQDFKQMTEPFWESKVLQPLIVVDTDDSLSVDQDEYDLPNDFLYTYSMKLDVNASAVLRKATLMGYNEALWKNDTTFSGATPRNPFYYIRETYFGVLPIPSETGSTYSHSYYKKPDTIESGVEFEIGAEAHNGIVQFAFSYALDQSSRPQEAINARQIAINLIKDL